MENQSTKTNGILEGVIWKQILLFFFPILIGTFFQQLYNTVDAVIVGRFAGKEALSCVGGSASLLINLIVGFFTGLTAGGSVIISQYYGAKNSKKLDEALHTSYGFGILGGILLSIVGVLIAPAILELMNTPAELMEQSVIYVRIYFSGMIFVFLYNMGASILRAIGDSKRPLYFLIICSFINIVLDLLFVLVLGLGVSGVAIATLLSQAFSTVLVTITLMKHTEGMKLQLRKIRISKSMLQKILVIGLPTGIQSSMYGISNMIIQTALNNYGVDTIAAWAAYGKLDCLFWMINGSFGIAITTFVGQNFGAGKWERVRKGTRVCMAMASGVAVFMSFIMVEYGAILFKIFTTDASVIEIGMRSVRIISPAYILFVFIEIFSGALRAEGYTLVTTIISIVGICAFRIIWVFFIVPQGTLEQISLCYPISWIICAVAISGYYFFKQKNLLGTKRGDEEI